MIKINGVEIGKIMHNGVEVDKLMSNGVEVYTKPTAPSWVKTHTLTNVFIYDYYSGYLVGSGGSIYPATFDGKTISRFYADGEGGISFYTDNTHTWTGTVIISTATESWTIPFNSNGIWIDEGANVSTLVALLHSTNGTDVDFKIEKGS